MTLSTLPLRHLSICSCGYGVLHDDIRLGTEYTVDLAAQGEASYRCGGCGKLQISVRVVKASSICNPNAPLAWAPLGLFVDSVGTARVQ